MFSYLFFQYIAEKEYFCSAKSIYLYVTYFNI